ncbi:MAG: peptidase M14 family protein, partial [Candidatus Saccharicenans sp.]
MKSLFWPKQKIRKNLIKIRLTFSLGFLFFLVSSGIFASATLQAEEKITSPETYFGFQLGADRKIARWDKIVQYFELLEKESSRIKVINMGPTSMGQPFLLVIISSPENLSKLDKIKEINQKISDPRGLPESQIPELISQGTAIICQSMSLHADEIGGTQMAPELAFELLARNDEE